MDPLFWLGLSILLVAVSITAVLMAVIPAVQELGRAARSAEKLFDTLHRELPPTLEAIRLTGLEISDLSDDMSEGVQNAAQVVKQVDQSLTGVKQQVHRAHITTRSVFAGFHAAWKSLRESEDSIDDLSPASQPASRSLPQPSVSTDPLEASLNSHPSRSKVPRAPIDPDADRAYPLDESDDPEAP